MIEVTAVLDMAFSMWWLVIVFQNNILACLKEIASHFAKEILVTFKYFTITLWIYAYPSVLKIFCLCKFELDTVIFHLINLSARVPFFCVLADLCSLDFLNFSRKRKKIVSCKKSNYPWSIQTISSKNYFWHSSEKTHEL